MMKRLTLACIFMLVAFVASFADNEVLKVSIGNINNYATVADIDSIYFSQDGETMMIQPKNSSAVVKIASPTTAQLTLVNTADLPKKLLVAFDGETATIDNPYLLNGMSVAVNGAYVTATNTNTSTELQTELSGTTQNGSFTYNGSYKTTIVLAGVDITSQKGAAIDIQCGKRVALELKKNTTNTLVDAADGEQKAALYCKGHLEIDKAGTLNVTGKTAHAISAKEYIQLKKSDGKINILGAVKDGIHCKQYFLGGGFTVVINNVGDDGIQTELAGEENDEGIVDGSMIINAGNYTINNATNGYINGSDTLTVKGLDIEGNLYLNGGTMAINMTGAGGKGIRVDGIFTQGLEDGTGPSLTVNTSGAKVTASSSNTGGTTGSWGWRPGGGGPGGGGWGGSSSTSSSSKAIKANGQITIYGGSMIVTTSTDGAEGLESKTGVTIAGGNHYFKCYDDCINSSGIIKFAGGNTVCYSYGNDAVDSNYGRSGAITIAGGNVFAYTTKGSPEEGLDCDNNSYITITGGIAVSAGGSQGGGGGWGGSSSSQSVGSSSQGYYLGSSPSSYGSSYYYTLCNTSGEAICTFKFEANVSNALSLLTAPNLGKGSVTVKYSTSAPTASTAQVNNTSGNGVFFIAPTITTSGTTATVTAK